MSELEITDAMVKAAAEAAWQAWSIRWPEPSWHGLQEAMRPALEAALLVREDEE